MPKPSNKTGVEEAFLAAYDLHADGIFRFVVSKTSNTEVANDLVQETFAKVWDYCAKGNHVDQWKAFLFRTAYNLIIDYYRKKRSVSLDEMNEDQGFIPADNSMTPANEEAEHARIKTIIGNMDDTYRDILMLRYTEDMSIKEIATTLDLRENVVSVRIHRGIKVLRERLHVDPENDQ